MKPLILKKVNLAPFTTIRIGGVAEYFCQPKSLEELKQALFFALERSLPIFVLGKGSNTIFGDFEGLVLSMKGFQGFEVKRVKEDRFLIYAEAGVSLLRLVSLSVEESLEGFYRLVGFPATVGGAVAMNAGAFGYETSQNLKEVVFLDWEGRLNRVKKQELSFSYRYSPFPKLGIVVGALFELQRASYEVRDEYREIREKRLAKQPINLPTCGSTFKNPKGYYAGKLLEEVGMKGYRIGDVAFSEKHANFLINFGKGSFIDALKIINEAKLRVFERFGLSLEEEVRIVESSRAYGWKV
ncbi:MAG: UDP-N-acetylmuramate dehydrogenase [Aquificaceae bacterium]